jgi:hypothetical protein
VRYTRALPLQSQHFKESFGEHRLSLSTLCSVTSRAAGTHGTRAAFCLTFLFRQGLAINLGIKEYSTGFHLREALVGRHGTPGEYKAEYEQVTPGARSYDGSYSDLRLLWKGVEARVQSGLDGDDLVLLVTPLKTRSNPRRSL